MKARKYLAVALAAALMLGSTCLFTACGSGDSDASDATAASKATKATKKLTAKEKEEEAKKASLATKASIMNKDVNNFYGTWVATSETAKMFYDHLYITINEDGTFDADVADEKFSGPWKKIDGGIEYTSDLMQGKTCKMTIENEGLNVTMKHLKDGEKPESLDKEDEDYEYDEE